MSDKEHDTGQTEPSNEATTNSHRQKRKKDFDLGNLLGQGAFGEVIEAVDKETHIKYAMKILSKSHIKKENKIKYAITERDAMMLLDHPNITKLFLTFQDPENLYYVIEYAEHGDLQRVLDKYYALSIPCVSNLMGQVLLGIAHMHKKKIIHRDLKPENILLDKNNRAKITDFGTCKIFGKDDKFILERGSFVGSADYVSPEVLDETPVGPSSDLWSYGCILYTLLVGETPFNTESNYCTFQRISNLDYKVPDFVPQHAKDLIEKLLIFDPEKRLGNGEFDDDYISIREHPFFAFTNWDELPKAPTPDWSSFQPALANREKKAILSSTINSQVPELLEEGEGVLFEGMIQKKRKLSIKNRLLVLTNKPRLFYCNKKKCIKGEIPITKDLVVKIENKKKWSITIPGRVYDIRCETGTPQEWKTHIEDILRII